MKQTIIRTYKDFNYSNLSTLDKLLKDGWFVVFVNPIGDYLEYILQKNN
jgi:hypothetical protein